MAEIKGRNERPVCIQSGENLKSITRRAAFLKSSEELFTQIQGNLALINPMEI